MHSRSELLRNACIRSGQRREFRRLSSPVWGGSQRGVLLLSRTGERHPVRCTDQQNLGPAAAYLTVGRAPPQCFLHSPRGSFPRKHSRYHAGWSPCRYNGEMEPHANGTSHTRGALTAVQRNDRAESSLILMER